jgi:hypothetical protein
MYPVSVVGKLLPRWPGESASSFTGVVKVKGEVELSSNGSNF